jgi:hypothetical protein
VRKFDSCRGHCADLVETGPSAGFSPVLTLMLGIRLRPLKSACQWQRLARNWRAPASDRSRRLRGQAGIGSNSAEPGQNRRQPAPHIATAPWRGEGASRPSPAAPRIYRRGVRRPQGGARPSPGGRNRLHRARGRSEERTLAQRIVLSSVACGPGHSGLSGVADIHSPRSAAAIGVA